MSLFQRITRAFHTLSTIELDQQSRFGALGEFYAEQVLDDGQAICINNPIVPHPTKPDLFLESDFLIYTQGSLFCVEIKNYKGRISYPVRYRVEHGWQWGSLPHSRWSTASMIRDCCRRRSATMVKAPSPKNTQPVEENHISPARCPAVERHP